MDRINDLNAAIGDEGPRTTYKLRAACLVDIVRLIVAMRQRSVALRDWRIELVGGEIASPDCTFTFTAAAPVEVLHKAIDTVDGGHVMRQTIHPIDRHAGIRTYGDDAR
jgi:hypothetical protein